jgi:hypothetical protein
VYRQAAKPGSLKGSFNPILEGLEIPTVGSCERRIVGLGVRNKLCTWVDLNHRPLGYECNKDRIYNNLQGTEAP